jgi:hypothetical protein
MATTAAQTEDAMTGVLEGCKLDERLLKSSISYPPGHTKGQLPTALNTDALVLRKAQGNVTAGASLWARCTNEKCANEKKNAFYCEPFQRLDGLYDFNGHFEIACPCCKWRNSVLAFSLSNCDWRVVSGRMPFTPMSKVPAGMILVIPYTIISALDVSNTWHLQIELPAQKVALPVSCAEIDRRRCVVGSTTTG